MDNYNKEEFYEKVTSEEGELTNTDIKINPDFYIHLALCNAQRALLKDDVKTGFLQYRVIIEYIESLARSGKMLQDSYEEEIKQYQESEEYKQAPSDVKSVKLAHKKLQVITREVFGNRTITQPGKL